MTGTESRGRRGGRTIGTSLLTAMACLLAGCADERVAGGGTETGNAEVVLGRILDSDGHGVGSLSVNLEEVKTHADGSDSGASYSAHTDSLGRYAFKAVKKGRFALYAYDGPISSLGASAILSRLEKQDSSLSLQDAIARHGVTLTGRVLPAAPTGIRDVKVCFPGLRTCVQPGADSVWSLADAPKGAYEILFLTPTAAHYLAVQVRAEAGSKPYVRDVTLRDEADADHVPYRFYALPQPKSFSIVPVAYPAGLEPAWYQGKDFADVNYSLLSETGPATQWNPDYLAAWKYARTWDGDSLYTGADMAKPLAGFPLLVRLAAPGFDFSQAAADGSDLVFSDATGRLLPFEIERWDAVAGRADIWVRLDSLAAAKADRKLRLHWGRIGGAGRIAPPYKSDGAKVFLPAEGFLGAWHFNDDDDANVVDARGAFTGSFTAPLPPEGAAGFRLRDGAVGPALRLGRTGSFVHVPYQAGLDVTQTFTVSAWARLQLPDNGTKQVLAAKWMTGRREWHFDIQPNRTFELEFGGADGAILGTWRSTTPVASPGEWHQYAAVFDKGAVKLYLDGAETAGTGATGSVPAAINHFTADLSLGSNSIDTTLDLRGDLDEFRLYSTAKSPEWLGMSYRTEKPRP